MNVVEMAREGLQPALSSAIREAMGRRTTVMRENLPVKVNGSHAYVNLSAVKLREPESLRNLLLVTFRPVDQPQPRTGRKQGDRPARDSRTVDLEREVQHTKDLLRTTVEELETSNEELKSANEELQSMNEELQSTNEELETSKEEMQSLNEELSTVNTELQSKVDDLAHANDDMQNLLNSIEVATIFLDDDLAIKRYTEQAKKLVNIIPTDIGRSIAGLCCTLIHNLEIHLDGLIRNTFGNSQFSISGFFTFPR
jgi:two-component system CheB/CheR fusion protein